MQILSKTIQTTILTLWAITALILANGTVRASSHDDAPLMPMGGDASATETGDIHALFANNEAIRRTVTNLADGIRTVTESDDPQVAATIKRHVADMMKRVAEKRDPGLPIESPALRAIFENYDKITTTAEQTETGVIVTQTSADATTVALLQKHAGEVTAFVEDGMEAMHTAMMQNMRGPNGGQQAGPMGPMMRGMRDQPMGQSMGMDQSNMMPGMMRGPMRAQMMQRARALPGTGAADDHSNH